MFRSEMKPSTRQEICPECRGSGKVMKNDLMDWGWKICQACNGTGIIEFATPPPRTNSMQRNPLKSRWP